MIKIKSVLFDIGNVLVTFEPRTAVLKRIVHRFGGKRERIDDLFESEPGEARYRALDTGRITHEELFRIVTAGTGIENGALSRELFSALYVEHLKPIAPMVTLARKLQNRFKLVAVSNGDFGSRYAASMLETHYGLEFAGIFVSAERGIKKPQLLENVCADLGICREECLFVDDVRKYVEAARGVGMCAMAHDATLESPSDFIAKLRDFDIVLS